MYRRTFVFSIVLVCLFSLSYNWVTVHARLSPAPSSSTAVLPGPQIAISWFTDATQYLPAAAYDSDLHEFLVVWHSDGGNGRSRLFGTRLNNGGQVISQFVLSGTHDRAQPSVAYDPVHQRYLVTWIEDVSDNGSNWDLFGAFVIPFPANTQLGTPFAINEFTTSQWNPQLVYAAAPAEFFVVWTNTYSTAAPPAYISGRRIRADGTFPSAGVDLTLSSSNNRVHPDVVYNSHSGQYLVVWEEVGTERDIYGQIMTMQGSLVSTPFGIAGWPGFEEYPSVAYCPGPDQYLVTWQALQPAGDYNLYGRLVTSSGTPGTVGLIQGLAGVHESQPSSACSPTGLSYYVLWQQQYSNLTGLYGIWGREVSTTFALGPVVALAQPQQGAVSGQKKPYLASGGAGYLAAWEHEIGVNTGHSIYGRLLANETVFLPLIVR